MVLSEYHLEVQYSLSYLGDGGCFRVYFIVTDRNCLTFAYDLALFQASLLLWAVFPPDASHSVCERLPSLFSVYQIPAASERHQDQAVVAGEANGVEKWAPLHLFWINCVKYLTMNSFQSTSHGTRWAFRVFFYLCNIPISSGKCITHWLCIAVTLCKLQALDICTMEQYPFGCVDSISAPIDPCIFLLLPCFHVRSSSSARTT